MVISTLYNIIIYSAVEIELTEQNLKMPHGKMAKLKQHLGQRGPLRWPLRSFLRLFVFNVFIFHLTHNT